VKSDIPARTFEFALRVVLLCRVLDASPGVPRTLAGIKKVRNRPLEKKFLSSTHKPHPSTLNHAPVVPLFKLQTSNFTL